MYCNGILSFSFRSLKKVQSPTVHTLLGLLEVPTNLSQPKLTHKRMAERSARSAGRHLRVTLVSVSTCRPTLGVLIIGVKPADRALLVKVTLTGIM